MTNNKWDKPSTEFEAFDILKYMPTREECEEGLENLSSKDRLKWLDFQRKWFFYGLPETAKFRMQKGIDEIDAIYHLLKVQESFSPKHEHKEEAVAYLASKWFKSIKYS